MKEKINVKTIAIVFLLFLNLFRPYIIPYYSYMKLNIVISIILILISKPTLKTLKENLFIIFFSIIIFISTYFYQMSNYNFLNGIRYSLQFLSLFFTTNSLIKKNGVKETVKYFYYTSLFIIIFSDISVLAKIKISNYEKLDNYIFGNKFILSYLHLLTYSLMTTHDNLNNNKKIIKKILFSILSLFICFYTNCLTGSIGIIIFTLLVFFPFKDKIKKILSEPSSIFIALYLLELLFIMCLMIYDLPFFQNIIKFVLNKEITFAGRYTIYTILPSIIGEKWLLGYGYNTSIVSTILGWGNAQNGLLQCLIDFGIIGTIMFFVSWYKCINIKYDKNNWPLYCAIYSFMICSLFEVCFKFYFFIILCLLFNIGINQKNINKSGG